MKTAVLLNSVYLLTGLPTPFFNLKIKRILGKTVIDLCENDPRWYFKQGEDEDMHFLGWAPLGGRWSLASTSVCFRR